MNDSTPNRNLHDEALDLVNRARAELLLPELVELPGPRWADPWDNTMVSAARAGLADPALNPAGAKVWASLEHDGLHLFFDADGSEELVPHTPGSLAYCRKLIAWSALAPPRVTRRGRRGGRAQRERRARLSEPVAA